MLQSVRDRRHPCRSPTLTLNRSVDNLFVNVYCSYHFPQCITPHSIKCCFKINEVEMQVNISFPYFFHYIPYYINRINSASSRANCVILSTTFQIAVLFYRANTLPGIQSNAITQLTVMRDQSIDDFDHTFRAIL